MNRGDYHQIDFLSECEHLGIHIFITFDRRNSSTKNANNQITKRTKVMLICFGILLSLIALIALAVSIYELIVISRTTATTTSKNKIRYSSSESLIHTATVTFADLKFNRIILS
jgi:hypothetical protein